MTQGGVTARPIAVAVAGGDLAAFALGAAPDTAPPVLAVHGITATSRAWGPVARALGPKAAIVAVDLRGRGDSRALPPPFGLDAHVRDLVAVLDHLGWDRAVVAGHSLGAYIAARLAVRHPDRVSRLVLVDGGLEVPGSREGDPEQFMRAFLAAALARLELTFPDVDAYVRWWRAHPALATEDVDPADLRAYAAHDLTGEPPAMRPSVVPEAIRADGIDLTAADDALALTVPAVLLHAPRGMIDDPNPMQPAGTVGAWATGDPARRLGVEVPDVNHYTIVLGRRGAAAVAAAIAESAAVS